MSAEQQHRTRISIHHGKYHVVCDICGGVGQPESFEQDAQAIADRHQAIGGFERPSR